MPTWASPARRSGRSAHCGRCGPVIDPAPGADHRAPGIRDRWCCWPQSRRPRRSHPAQVGHGAQAGGAQAAGRSRPGLCGPRMDVRARRRLQGVADGAGRADAAVRCPAHRRFRARHGRSSSSGRSRRGRPRRHRRTARSRRRTCDLGALGDEGRRVSAGPPGGAGRAAALPGPGLIGRGGDVRAVPVGHAVGQFRLDDDRARRSLVEQPAVTGAIQEADVRGLAGCSSRWPSAGLDGTCAGHCTPSANCEQLNGPPPVEPAIGQVAVGHANGLRQSDPAARSSDRRGWLTCSTWRRGPPSWGAAATASRVSARPAEFQVQQ